MPSLPATLAVAAAAAALPGAFAWWSGQRLARDPGEPMLPELLQRREANVARVSVVAMMAAALLAGGMLWWVYPAAILLVALAAMPMRRRLFDERVGAPAYVEHVVRGFVATFGFWALLVAVPSLVLSFPPAARPWGALALGLVLVLWQALGIRLWLACMDAAPLDRRDLEPLLRDVAVRSTAPMPRLVKVVTPGVHLVNAWALPSTGVATVAFSRRLLELAPPDEVAAIFAHEMAHLEELVPARVWRGRAAAVVLAAIVALLPFVAPPWFASLFPFVVLLALVMKARQSRAAETASDARAVALLDGDGEALARALTRIHLLARLPRRIEREVEDRSTHPSLARRIQAIREATRLHREAHAPAATPLPSDVAAAAHALVAEPPSLARRMAAMPLPVLLQAPGERTVVALGPERLYWFDDVPGEARLDVDALREAAGSYHALRYPDLTELRVAAAGSERQLVVRERSGDARRLPLHPADVALAQRALDLVDGQLGHPVAERGPMLARVVALVLVLLAPLGAALALPVWALSALVLWWPARPALAALAAAAATDAATTWLGGGAPAGTTPVLLAELALAGLLVLLATQEAAAREAERAPSRAMRLGVAGAVLLAAMLAALGVLVTGLPAREWATTVAESRLAAAAATMAAGLAGLLATLAAGRRLVRHPRLSLAGAAAALAVAAAGLATAWASARETATVAWRDVTATVAARVPVPEGALRLEVSPSGTRWAVMRPVARGAPVSDALVDGFDWELGSFAEGRTRTVRALQLAFLDDARVVILARRGDGMEVRLEPAFAGEDPLPRRAAPLPAVGQPTLRVDRTTGRWFVAGRPRTPVTVRGATSLVAPGAVEGTFESEDDEAELEAVRHALAPRPDTLLLATGVVGRDSALVRRWVLPSVGTAALPLADGGALYWEMPRGDAGRPWWAALLTGSLVRGTLWRLGPDGARTRLASTGIVACGQAGSAGALCVERDFSRAHGLLVDARGHVTARLALPSGIGPMTRPSGTQLALASYTDPVVSLLDAATRRGRHVLLGERVTMLDVAPTPQGFVSLQATGPGEGYELVSWRVPR